MARIGLARLAQERHGQAGHGKARALVSTTTQTKYPLDTAGLTKGSIVDTETVERIANASRGTAAFHFWLLKLSRFIRRELRDRGQIITITTRKERIEILADAKASEYNGRWFKHRQRGMRRNFRQAAAVDRAHLTGDEQNRHDTDVARMGAVVLAMKAATRKPIELKPAERSAPASLGAGKVK